MASRTNEPPVEAGEATIEARRLTHYFDAVELGRGYHEALSPEHVCREQSLLKSSSLRLSWDEKAKHTSRDCVSTGGRNDDQGPYLQSDTEIVIHSGEHWIRPSIHGGAERTQNQIRCFAVLDD